MEKHYELFVGIDVSKGKADAAILRSVTLDRLNLNSCEKSYLSNSLDPMCYLFYLLLEANMMITVPM